MDTFSGVAQKLSLPGSVGVIPTDTVYGLVAPASDEAAVTRLYGLKSREAKPGTIIAASTGQLETLGLKHRYLKAVEQFWPAAVSVIIPCGPELAYLHQGKYSLAVRIPDYPALQKLLEQTGPLLTSSANKTSEPPATTVAEAQTIFGEQVDFYRDGGSLSDRHPSTIIRVVDDAVEVLRQGVVKIENNGVTNDV